MFKKIIIGVIVLGVIVLAGWKLFLSKDDVSSTIQKRKDELTAYHMEATMELENNENVKKYLVETDYQKKDNSDYFKVAITDNSVNQKQIIIRNNDGVFVLTPMLNQVYKFKSDWPTNSPKPYLYHTILNGFDEKHEIKKSNDGIILTTNPNYKNNPSWVKQDTKLTDSLEPKYINIYNAKNEAIVKIDFTKVDFAPKFDENYFDVKTNMEESRTNLTSVSLDEIELPYYPTGANMSATKKEETTSKIGNTNVVILVYEGVDAFTVVQSLVEPSEEIVYQEIDGTLESVLTGVAYSKNNYLVYIDGNVKYQIYSSDMSVDKKLEVAQGMEENLMK